MPADRYSDGPTGALADLLSELPAGGGADGPRRSTLTESPLIVSFTICVPLAPPGVPLSHDRTNVLSRAMVNDAEDLASDAFDELV
jgi:hypothetical protein